MTNRANARNRQVHIAMLAQQTTNIMKFLSSVESLNSFFEWGSLLLIAGTVAFGAGAILTSRIIKSRQEQIIADANKKAGEANEKAAVLNERAAGLDKKAAEFQLELARIDPVNLPIKSMSAKVFLMIRGEFFDWYFSSMLGTKIAAEKACDLGIVGKEITLATMRCVELETFPVVTIPGGNKVDGRTLSISFAWPSNEWIDAQPQARYWIERENASTAMLDKDTVFAQIAIPPSKGDMEIVTASCVVTINGSIERRFAVPKTAPAGGLINCFPQR